MPRPSKTVLLTEARTHGLQDYIDGLKSVIDSMGWVVAGRSCGVTKDIQQGDRVFLLLQGAARPGVIGSGWALQEPYEDEHWKDPSRTALYVQVCFDILINPFEKQHLERQTLQDGVLGTVRWNTQSSGITINAKAAEELEKRWEAITGKHAQPPDFDQFFDPTEAETEESTEPPERFEVTTFRFNRDRLLPEQLKEAYDFQCQRCDYVIQNPDGSRYAEAAHVHPLEHGGTDTVDNLLCLCPTCHKELDLGCGYLDPDQLTFVDGHRLSTEIVKFYNANIYRGGDEDE